MTAARRAGNNSVEIDEIRAKSRTEPGVEASMFDLDAIQGALREFGLDGWLLYDFRGSNLPARRVLDLEAKPAGTRRFLYAIPARGAPRKLVHRIEPGALDTYALSSCINLVNSRVGITTIPPA